MLILDPESYELVCRELSVIVGERLTSTRRIHDFQRFEFGEQKPSIGRRGGDYESADYCINSVNWQFTGPDDYYVDRTFYTYGIGWDERSDPFWDVVYDVSPVVESLEVKPDGALVALLEGRYRLDCLIGLTPEQLEDEQNDWAFKTVDRVGRRWLYLRATGELVWDEYEDP